MLSVAAIIWLVLIISPAGMTIQEVATRKNQAT
jgi:hypothetical protein